MFDHFNSSKVKRIASGRIPWHEFIEYIYLNNLPLVILMLNLNFRSSTLLNDKTHRNSRKYRCW